MDETTSRIPTTRDTVIAKARQCGRHWLFVGDQDEWSVVVLDEWANWPPDPEPQTAPERGTTGGE